MAYTIKYHGYEVACDTVDDLRALVNQNGDKRGQTGQGDASFSREPRVSQGEAARAVAGLVAKLPKEQRDLLRAIATNGVVSRDRLRQLLGISDTHKCAGLLIGISKSAVGAGIESPIEKQTVRIDGRGPRVYQYGIRDGVKSEVKEALSK